MTHVADAHSAPRWSVDIPDLTGRRAVVTGASDGVGVEIARGLARGGAEVIMPVRSKSKGERAIARIRDDDVAASLSLRSLDLSSLASTRALARQLRAEGTPIDILVLNAGIVLLKDRVRHLTADGIELHLQTNALSHALLVAELLPLLRARGGRVVVQCSLATRYGAIRWNDVNLERGYRPLRAYAASKVALGLFGVELASRNISGEWGIRTVLCHPGIAMTNIVADEMSGRTTRRARLVGALYDRGIGLQSPAEAALPALYAATSREADDGDLVAPSGFCEISGEPALRPLYRTLLGRAEAARVWDLVTELTGARFPDAAEAAAQAKPNGVSTNPRTSAQPASTGT